MLSILPNLPVCAINACLIFKREQSASQIRHLDRSTGVLQTNVEISLKSSNYCSSEANSFRNSVASSYWGGVNLVVRGRCTPRGNVLMKTIPEGQFVIFLCFSQKTLQII